jgi:hypothetical protein
MHRIEAAKGRLETLAGCPVLGQLPRAQLSLGDVLEPGPLEVTDRAGGPQTAMAAPHSQVPTNELRVSGAAAPRAVVPAHPPAPTRRLRRWPAAAGNGLTLHKRYN